MQRVRNVHQKWEIFGRFLKHALTIRRYTTGLQAAVYKSGMSTFAAS